MKNTLYIIVFMLLLCTQAVFAQSIEGKWKTIDDETGEAKSIVKIYQKDGKIYGKVIDILNPAKRDNLCVKCKGDKKDKPVLGMVIIDGLSKNGNEYKRGTVLDPEKGKEYSCKIWLDEDDNNKLYVRGYVAFLYRTQNWYRVE